MKTRSWSLLFATLAALAAPLLLSVATRAGDPEPLGDADAGPGPLDGGAEAGADVAAPPPPLPSYRAEPFPEEHSPEPKAREWATAPRVAIDRTRGYLVLDVDTEQRSVPCEARRVREWMRIRCSINTGAISLLGGTGEGLAMRLDRTKKEDFVTFPEGGEIVFPVRRGDRREIEWLEVAFGYKGMSSVEPSFMLSEQWIPGDPHPRIVAE